ncbi:4060_t:CDS:2 [Rhizophagus irregularis]|nr:4060_t:CDS:2 [Rhizophagus irregularis]
MKFNPDENPDKTATDRSTNEADNLQTNIDLWNDDMKKLAKSEVNNRVNMRNLENMTISTGISAGIQHFKTYNSQLLISQQYASMRFDSAEQERKRKADENSEVDGSGIIEWEFDCAILTWLEKGMLYHKELISEEDEDKRIKDSSKSIWWRIVDGSDLDVTREYLSEEECLELQEVLANALELGTTINDWTILKPQAEKCLQDLSKLNNDQIKIIGEKVLHKGTRGALEELKNFLKTKTVEIDYLDEDVTYIFDLIRFTGEPVSRARRDKAHEGDERFHLDWLFCEQETWGREFSLCKRAGSVIDNLKKIFSNTLKIKKNIKRHAHVINEVYRIC